MTTEARPVRPTMPPVTPGICDTGHPVCGAPGRLYAAGYRCLQHQPTTHKPDTQTTRKDNQ